MSCCLCSSFASASSAESWNTPLFVSANFLVLPSLGSLVEGWVLIVPKKHFICMGALPPELASEMNQLKSRVWSVLSSKYGEICAFEHGPNAAKRTVGCGVDHAHLHLVPFAFDLVRAAAPFLPSNTEWHPATFGACKQAFEEEKDYLYIEQPLGVRHIAKHSEFGSQIFRKAIASSLGMLEEFNWREHPQVEIVAKTIGTLGANPRFSDGSICTSA
jgi:ATP adenylyltransferase